MLSPSLGLIRGDNLMAFIKILAGERKGTRIDIDRDEVVFGRAPDNLIVLKDESVSSKHCAIIRNGRNFVIRDLGSTNGTCLNDIVIQEHQLSPKDTITVGSIDVLFDGDDIEPYTPITKDIEEPQVTIKMPTSSSATNTKVFNKRKKKGWSIIAILTIGAMGIFLFSILKK